MVVDGVRMNTAIFRSGNIQNVLSIDPASLEGVEVVFGPGSLLYGSDAIGGVMDFHYTTPEFSQDSSMLVEGDAFVRYATVNEEKTGHINFKLGGEKWASYSSIGYTDVNELRMGSVGPDSYLRNEYVISQNGQDTVITNPDPELQVPSGMQLGSFVQKFRWKPASAWDVQAGIYYSGTSNYDRYDRLIEYRNDLPRSAEWYYGPQTWGMARASILHEGNNKVYDIARLTIAVQQFGESRNDRSFQSSSLRTRTEGVNAYSANLDLRKGDSTFSWLYGLESVLNTISSAGSSLNLSNSTTSDVSTRYPDGSTWQSHAVYISNKWKPTNDLTVQSGLRYNLVNLSANFDTTFFPLPFIKTSLSNGALTGSLGLAWIASPKWQFNLNAATGFRSPNIDDIGKIFDSEPGNVVVPNPDLEPEYVYSIDAGVRYKNAVFDLQLNGFYAILTNAIVRRDYQLDGQDSILYDGTLSQVQALQNTDRANVYGIEAALNYQINRFFSIRTQVTITEGEEQSVDASGPAIPLRHAPPAFGAVHGLFQIDRFKADLFWMWNAEVPFEELAPTEIDKDYLYAADSNGNPYSPAWSTLNIQLSYQLNTWLNISAGVENITDVRYRTYSSGIVAPGRNYIVSLRSSF
jgi:hemoglobin/transferrin/lactoferrin receptor protein